MLIYKKLPLITLFAVISFLLWQSFLPQYRTDLIQDVPYFYARVNFFLQHFSFNGLTGNEYQPGALLFFIIISPFLLISNTMNSFLTSLFIANIILIFINGYIFVKNANNLKSLYIYSLILLFSGPILFFRFDLAVITLVNLSLLLWIKDKKYLALVLLSIGTQIKIYPVLFLPIFLILEYKKYGLKEAIKLLLFFALSFIIFLFSFLLIFKSNLSDLVSALNYHSLKSVHIESIWGQIISSYQTIFLHKLPSIEVGNGIWGISKDELGLSLFFYNWVWVIPLSFLYLYFFKKIKNYHSSLDLRLFLLTILVFLIFSKVLTHQYLFWFLLLIPNLNWSLVSKKSWIINIALILIITLLHQYIYPLNYLKFIESFSNSNSPYSYLIYLNILRCLLIIVILLRFLYDLKAAFKLESHR